jgi:hypothetical protein
MEKERQKTEFFEGIIPQIAGFRVESGKLIPSNLKKLGFCS